MTSRTLKGNQVDSTQYKPDLGLAGLAWSRRVGTNQIELMKGDVFINLDDDEKNHT